MNVKVDQDLCISCGMCTSSCPEVFEYNSENKSTAKTEEVPTELQEEVEDCAGFCPTQAITLQ